MIENSDILIDKHGIWYFHGEEMTPRNNIPLWTGKDNVIYCRVKRRQYVARFSRPTCDKLCELGI
jgi:hypothetical protein